MTYVSDNYTSYSAPSPLRQMQLPSSTTMASAIGIERRSGTGAGQIGVKRDLRKDNLQRVGGPTCGHTETRRETQAMWGLQSDSEPST